MNTALKFAAAAVIGSMAVATPAAALTIVDTDVIALTTTNWNLNVTLDKFDTNLGPLNSILVEITGRVIGDIGLESRDAAPAALTATISALQTLNKPGGGFLINVFPAILQNFNASIYDGVDDFGGTSGIQYTGLEASDSDATFIAPIDFGLFSAAGGGVLNMAVSAVGTSGGTGAGNLLQQFSTQAEATVKITYDYGVSTPEPASMALLGAGMLALGFARRRRG